MGGFVTTDKNASTFTAFKDFFLPFFQTTGEGLFCFPLDIGAANISGVGDGTNVTIQVEFNGGDGNLFQVCYFILFIAVQNLI